MAAGRARCGKCNKWKGGKRVGSTRDSNAPRRRGRSRKSSSLAQQPSGARVSSARTLLEGESAITTSPLASAAAGSVDTDHDEGISDNAGANGEDVILSMRDPAYKSIMYEHFRKVGAGSTVEAETSTEVHHLLLERKGESGRFLHIDQHTKECIEIDDAAALARIKATFSMRMKCSEYWDPILSMSMVAHRKQPPPSPWTCTCGEHLAAGRARCGKCKRWKGVGSTRDSNAPRRRGRPRRSSSLAQQPSGARVSSARTLLDNLPP